MNTTVIEPALDSNTGERCAESLTQLLRQRSVTGEQTTAHLSLELLA